MRRAGRPRDTSRSKAVRTTAILTFRMRRAIRSPTSATPLIAGCRPSATATALAAGVARADTRGTLPLPPRRTVPATTAPAVPNTATVVVTAVVTVERRPMATRTRRAGPEATAKSSFLMDERAMATASTRTTGRSRRPRQLCKPSSFKKWDLTLRPHIKPTVSRRLPTPYSFAPGHFFSIPFKHPHLLLLFLSAQLVALSERPQTFLSTTEQEMHPSPSVKPLVVVSLCPPRWGRLFSLPFLPFPCLRQCPCQHVHIRDATASPR